MDQSLGKTDDGKARKKNEEEYKMEQKDFEYENAGGRM